MVAYTPELAQNIVDRVANGETVYAICQEENTPGRRTFSDWVRKYPDLAAQYARAQADRADHRADIIDQICKQLLEGKIASDVARVAIDTQKWQAGKDNPKKYSDKHQIELTGKDGEPLSVRLLAVQERLLKNVTPDPLLIEHENAQEQNQTTKE